MSTSLGHVGVAPRCLGWGGVGGGCHVIWGLKPALFVTSGQLIGPKWCGYSSLGREHDSDDDTYRLPSRFLQGLFQ